MAEKVIIIGSGPAGWASAIYTARAALEPLVFEGAITYENQMSGTLPLGQLALTTEVENYPGFPAGDLESYLDSSIDENQRKIMAPHAKEGVSGPELMEMMRQQAKNMGTRIITRDIVGVDFAGNSADGKPFVLTDSDGQTHEALSVIVATGARANYLGMESEETYRNKGVSACAVCDGALPRFRNHPLVVVGGGDSAVEEADYLSKFAQTVYLVHRRDELRASKVMAKRANNHRTRCNINPNTAMETYNAKNENFKDIYTVEKIETKEGWACTSPDEDWFTGYPQETEAFYRTIAYGDEPQSTGQLAANTISTIYSAYLSADRAGAAVEIKTY